LRRVASCGIAAHDREISEIKERHEEEKKEEEISRQRDRADAIRGHSDGLKAEFVPVELIARGRT